MNSGASIRFVGNAWSITHGRLSSRSCTGAGPQMQKSPRPDPCSPDALTIGFTRRFASYKRATLLLRDIPRLKRILMNPYRSVQILIAGKAHPHDSAGKDLIRQIIHFARDPEILTAWSSWKITASAWPATWCRAPTSG